MILGSDNVFFVIDRDDQYDLQRGMPPMTQPEGLKAIRDGYRAIVFWDGPKLAQINCVNLDVRSFARQLVWDEETIRWEHPWEHDGKTLMLPYEKTFPKLRDFWAGWLTKNVGAKFDKWDTYTRGREHGASTIFFKRRKDALAFVRAVQDMLVIDGKRR